MGDPETTIEGLLAERRVFEPQEAFRSQAVVGDPAVYERAATDYEGFWAEQASRLVWSRPWDRVVDWDPPWVKWFVGGKLNVSHNCLDRHVEDGGGEKVAYYWEGEPGDRRTITYRDLLDDVCRLANGLRLRGDIHHAGLALGREMREAARRRLSHIRLPGQAVTLCRAWRMMASIRSLAINFSFFSSLIRHCWSGVRGAWALSCSSS